MIVSSLADEPAPAAMLVAMLGYALVVTDLPDNGGKAMIEPKNDSAKRLICADGTDEVAR